MRVIFLEYDCELSDKKIVIYFHPTDTFLVTLDDFLNCPQTNLASAYLMLCRKLFTAAA